MLTDRPYVFLDVDGVLIPFAARATGRSPSPVAAADLDAIGNPLLERLDPADGRRLLALDCQLVWATTWMHRLDPQLGLTDADFSTIRQWLTA